jgi:HEAT repeat protein
MKVLREMSVEFKREAVKALINQGERAIPQLAEALNDDDRDYREAASQVLWGIGEPAVPTLIRTARNGSSGAKLVAIGALGGMQAEDAVDVLIEDLQDEDENVRAAAAWALGQIQSGKAIDALTKAMDDPSSKVQSAAENALRQIKSETGSGSSA